MLSAYILHDKIKFQSKEIGQSIADASRPKGLCISRCLTRSHI